MSLPKRWLITVVLSPHGSASVELDKSVPHYQFREQTSSLIMKMAFFPSGQQTAKMAGRHEDQLLLQEERFIA